MREGEKELEVVDDKIKNEKGRGLGKVRTEMMENKKRKRNKM